MLHERGSGEGAGVARGNEVHQGDNQDLSRISEIASRVHNDVIERGHLGRSVESEALQQMVGLASPLSSTSELEQIAQMVTHRLYGLGPLEALMNDPLVSEIMINGPGTVWVERSGALFATDTSVDGSTLRMIIDRALVPLGLRADRTSPFADGRLPDGSRVHVAVPPLAVDGPYLTIRRFRPQPYELADFCSPEVAKLLGSAVSTRRSILVSGGTSTGKTSLLNALGAHIGGRERVVTIEDAAELSLPGSHIVRLEARPANAEGVGEMTIRHLVRNALRMRPDRLVLGESRGGEAFDVIQAMNTGHEGSMTTCHAASALESLDRFEAMMLMSDVELPLEVARRQLRTALDLVVHLRRNLDGRREIQTVMQVGSAAQDHTILFDDCPESGGPMVRRELGLGVGADDLGVESEGDMDDRGVGFGAGRSGSVAAL